MAEPLLPGTRFSRLVVVSHDGGEMVETLCDCGRSGVRLVGRRNLIRGRSKSCGCARWESAAVTKTVHGGAAGGANSRVYAIWAAMRRRCQSPLDKCWLEYGARGIAVCEEWASFPVFRDWALANGYSEALTIDRIDNKLGYGPDNCRWATRLEQTRNRRNTVRVPYRGEMLVVPEIARRTGKKTDYFYHRLRVGVPLDRLADGL